MASKIGCSHKTGETIKRSLIDGAKKNSECQCGREFSTEHKYNLSIAQKKRYSNPEQRKIARKNALRVAQTKSINDYYAHNNPPVGEMNGRWKGGMSDLYTQLRRDIIDWKKLSSEFCDYKCVLTENRFQHIHHLISFDYLIQNALNIVGIDKRKKVADYTSEEYENLRQEVIHLHSSTLYGACLCKELHELFHKEYTYFNPTIDDFLSFVNDLESKKYNGFLQENELCLNINEKYINYLMSNRINTVA